MAAPCRNLTKGGGLGKESRYASEHSFTLTTLSCLFRFVFRLSSVAATNFCLTSSCFAQAFADRRARAMNRAICRNVRRVGFAALFWTPDAASEFRSVRGLRLPRIFWRMSSSSRSCALLLFRRILISNPWMMSSDWGSVENDIPCVCYLEL